MVKPQTIRARDWSEITRLAAEASATVAQTH
jgi:hypothetical protein